jgi:hypothetical protein
LDTPLNKLIADEKSPLRQQSFLSVLESFPALLKRVLNCSVSIFQAP